MPDGVVKGIRNELDPPVIAVLVPKVSGVAKLPAASDNCVVNTLLNPTLEKLELTV